ncbi:RHS repeat-associated protein [Allocatelliglobosispora scoriae]|uniref:RHS repeat-associated protein n=1 Tax=Allocatelliglobosispora scoriae TaxID=643052 RepID=A0A841BNL0_9ACTN|nr:RHS repeat-associated core domain-containing protein [Allocatelliglobosispora scoriae]MBB5868543.1 RHS repeat-associated protein [Allocatelliglobosispora scoriae]
MTVELSVDADQERASKTSAAAKLTKPASVRVDVLNRRLFTAAGAAVAVRLARADGEPEAGQVRVTLDYNAFRDAYGADWDNRLGLVLLPSCVATTPELAECQQRTWLSSVNRADTGTVSADVYIDAAGIRTSATSVQPADASVSENPEFDDLGLIVALAAAGASDSGDFRQTPLSQSFSWQAGGSGGDFSWSYPILAPPVPGGLAPAVSLDYSSGSVDGQTAGKNVQPGAIGEGWSYEPGFIERTYRPCNDDTANSPAWATQMDPLFDNCWRLPNASIVWNGVATDLVPDDASAAPNSANPTVWHLANDPGVRVEWLKLTDGRTNYDNDKEYWRVTTQDGTQYYFGLNQLPGWTSGKRETQSAWGVPVFANHTGEPCFNATTWTSSWCSQIWRWNLDYVVDRHGNSMAYFYTKDQGYTGLRNNATKTWYDHGGWLDHIEYGMRAGTELANATPPAKIVFGMGDRCFTASCGTHDGTNWPDTPWDLDCQSGTTCPNNPNPTFWTKKRLATISAQIWSGTGTTYNTVDSWALGGQFPTTNNGTKPVLWLTGITRTGSGTGVGVTGANITLPAVSFTGTYKMNRADYDPNGGMAAPRKYRIDHIATETGGQIDVTYSAQDANCQFGGSFPDPDNNTRRCFPQYYSPQQAPAGWSWWHKYLVTSVVEKDLVGGSPDILHSYDYAVRVTTAGQTVGGTTSGTSQDILWHYGLNAFGGATAYRSWSEWRGYPVVTEVTGPVGGTQSKVRTLYFRGLHGGRTDSGDNTRTASITDSLGTVSTDSAWSGGRTREKLTYDGNTDTILSKTIFDPVAVQTGTRTLTTAWAVSYPKAAYMVDTSQERNLTWLAGSASWRTAATQYTYDQYGNITSQDRLGDISTASDDSCLKTTYNHKTTGSTYGGAAYYLVSFPQRAETLGVACTTTPAYPADARADTRYYYDQAGAASPVLATAPTKGVVTQTDQVRDYTGLTPNWIKTGTVFSYDAFGRSTEVKDALDHSTKMTYTETSGLTTKLEVDNALGVSHRVTSVLNPGRSLPVTVTDPNGKVTTGQYDALGRLLKVWQPGHLTSGTPDVEYAYGVAGGAAAPYILTKALGPDGQQISSYEILDGLLRSRQTQSPNPTLNGKRVVTETSYDGRGLVVKSSAYPNSASAPSSTLATAAADTTIEIQQRFTYDGTGRQLTEQLWSLNIEQSRTSNTFDGDRVTADQPTGGTDTTVIVDALGRTTSTLQYQGTAPTGPADTTTYDYDELGQRTKITDAAGNHWDYTYDLLGRNTTTVDPDSGTSTTEYDNAGQVVSTKDSLTQVVVSDYDVLGRTKGTYAGSLAPANQLTGYTYDPVGAKGQLATSTRYVGGAAGAAYTSRVTAYDDSYLPLSTELTIPTIFGGTTAENALAGTYLSSATYKVNGAPATTVLPAVGGLPAETITYIYNAVGQQKSMASTWVGGSQTYAADTTYEYDGQAYQRILGNAGKSVRQTFTYEAASRRLSRSQLETEDQSSPGAWVNQTTDDYSFDLAGNLKSIAGKTNGTADQEECFGYDHLRRLDKAWTQVSGACTTPQKTGADPYWMAWSFDVTGNRKSQTTYNTNGTEYSKSTYTYPAPGAGPHTLGQVTTTGAGAGTASYTYDAAGNTKTRPAPVTGTQNLDWDTEGHLDKATVNGNVTTFIYDAGGARLLRKDPGSWATLTLPDGTELRANSTGAVAGIRYYAGTAVRAVNTDGAGNPTNGNKLTWTISDHHATGTVTIDAGTMVCQRRRSLPYGQERGAQPTGFGTKGFVGGTTDPTGLIHLGAREYDPATGRFISVDPVFMAEDPQSWNGYAYANNSPTTGSDATGTCMLEDGQKSCKGDPGDYDPGPKPKDDGGGSDDNAPGSQTTYCSTGRTEFCEKAKPTYLIILGGSFIAAPSEEELKEALQAAVDKYCGGTCPKTGDLVESTIYHEVCDNHPSWCKNPEISMGILVAGVGNVGYQQFGTPGKPPHTAVVTYFDKNGNVILSRTIKSGNITAQERALGLKFPQNTLITHTETRAVRVVPQNAAYIVIEGSYDPCTSCKSDMRQAAQRGNRVIVYRWDGRIWMAAPRASGAKLARLINRQANPR